MLLFNYFAKIIVVTYWLILPLLIKSETNFWHGFNGFNKLLT